ncbi:MFS transporter [Geomicrobium sp. JSM 1781026]|uniref:MFS transporter n=1 Tax=Geomicrobium sp. JSM 1781026 TaxID=3344580 RepID=UPI0035BF72DC
MNKNLKLLWAGDFSSTLGASIYLLAVTLLAHQLSDSIFQASMVLFAGTVPYFFFGIIGGVVADRYNKKKLMILCELVRAFLVLVIPILFYFEALTVTTLIIISVLLTIFRAFYFPTNQASVFILLEDKEKLNQVNSYFNITKNIAAMMGPSFGGVFLIFNLEVSSLLFINCLAYVLSAFFLTIVNFPVNKNIEENKKQNIFVSAWLGLKYMLYDNKSIAVMMFAFFCQLLLGVGVIQLAIPNLLYNLNLSTEELLGFVLSTITLSSVISSFVMAKIKVKKPINWLFFGYSLRSVVLLILGFSTNFTMVLFAAFIMGISFTIGGITLTTYLQTASEESMLGRVMALRSTLGNVTDGLAYLIVGFVLSLVSLFWAFIAMSLYTLLSVLFSMMLWKVAHKKDVKQNSNKGEMSL